MSNHIEKERAATDDHPSATVYPNPSKTHFYWIDWLRFLAAFGVLIGHVRGSTWVEWSELAASSHRPFVFAAFALSRLGYEAVIVFFVLSGFLVGGKAIERVMKGIFDLQAFAIDRCTRIYVPLVPALLFGWMAAIICGNRPKISDLAWNLLGCQGWAAPPFAGNAPLWSLSYEIWFYVLAGAVAGLYTLAATAKPWVFLIMTCALGVFVKLSAVLLFCWSLGAMAYALIETINVRRMWLWWVAAIIVPTGLLLCQLATDSVSLKKTDLQAWMPSQEIASLVLALGVSILVVCITQLRPRTSLTRKLDQLGTRLAAFSYTLYLTHYPVMLLWTHYHPVRLNTISATSLVFFTIQVVLCVLVALLMYQLFEARTTRMRRWLQCRVRGCPRRVYSGE